MNEDKIRAEFESKMQDVYKLARDADGYYLYENTTEAWNIWQAALATRPDVNQELVEALDELVGLKRYKDANGKDEYYIKHQPLTWEKARQALVKHKAAKVSNSTGLESAPDKAADAGFTEEYLVNKIMEELPSFSIAIHNPDDVTNYKYAMNISKNIIHALKAAGALRLRGE